MQSLFDWLKSVENTVLFKLGDHSFTLGNLFYLAISLAILFYLTGVLKRFLVNRVFARFHMELGVSQAIATLVRYMLVLIGSVIIIQTSGIDLSTVGLLIGGLGIGIGLGLQNIVTNLISGIIILFERPIKVGDRVEVGGILGMVKKISPRSTTILTNDNVAIIVPNAEFMTTHVINWSHNDDKIRFHVSVNIQYEADFHRVSELLLEIAKDNPDVLDNPPPDIRLEEFGDHGIRCTMLVWSSSLLHRQGKLKSNINKAIYKKFKEHGIEIPYAQREIRFRNIGAKDLPFNDV